VQTNSSSEALEAVDEETSIQVHQKEDLVESNAIVAETEAEEDPDKQPEDQASSKKATTWTFPSKLESNSSSARDDAFIPEAAETTKPIASPHPEAAPAASSSPPRPRRTFISLFDRMTGATRQQDAETMAPPAEPKIVPKIETPSAENPIADQDQAEDKKSAKTDEYLDIPTFLRRQAN
jgi:hypothetical protein